MGPLSGPYPDLGRQTQTLWKLLPCHRTGEGRRGRADPSSLSPGATMACPCRCHGGRQPGSPRGPPCTCRAKGAKRDAKSPAGPPGGPSATREGILFLLEPLGSQMPPPHLASRQQVGPCPVQVQRAAVPSSHSASAARPSRPLAWLSRPLLPPGLGATCWLMLFLKCVGVCEPRDLPLADFHSSLWSITHSVPPVQASCRDTGASDGPLCEPLDWQARRGSTRHGT